MVANKYGSLDKDRLGKEVADKPLKGAGDRPGLSALIGGVGNLPRVSDADTSDKGQNKGSAVPTPSGDSIPPYKEGGFRNKAMEHKRG